MTQISRATKRTDVPLRELKPWPGLPWVLAIALVLRLGVALVSEQIYHPDEVFQYLEQGHRLAFGYGVVPWEYRFGLRNWILPGLIGGVLSLCGYLGLDQPQFYMALLESLGCLLSLSLVYGAYRIGRRLVSEEVGRLACVLTAGWHELIIMAQKLTPEVLGAYLLVGAVALLVGQPRAKIAFLTGICGTGAMVLRLQYAPAVAVVAVAACFFWPWRLVVMAAAGGVAMLLTAGLVDGITWGVPFVSFYHNYLYNKVYGLSSIIWGAQSPWFYLQHLAPQSGGLFLVAIIYGVLRPGRKPWLMLALVVSLLLPHSLIAHKEYRFIFAIVPFCLVLSAIALSDLGRWLAQRSWPWGITATALVMAGSTWGLMINTHYLSRQDGVQALLFLHDQPALVSVLNLYGHWYGTGGYYHLHRNVPVFLPEHLATIELIDLANYFSHILCSVNQGPIDGFETIAQFDSIEVRQNSLGTPPSMLDMDTHTVFQWGVEDVFQPRITPRF
jgi:phosphatidylinositol glycan class B